MEQNNLNNTKNDQAAVNQLSSTTTDKVPSTVQEPKKANQSKKKIFIVVLISLFVVALIGGGIYSTQKDNSTTSKESKKYSVTYSKTTNLKLPGTGDSRGMSFEKPNEISNVIKVPDPLSKASYNQLKDSIEIARLLATMRDFSYIPATSTTTGGPSPVYAQHLRKDLVKDPQSVEYQRSVKSVEAFVQGAFTSPIKASLGSAEAFTNSTIKKDAWQFDVSTSGNPENGTPTQKGKAVILIGKDTYYYFLITATENNWSSNTKVFTTVLDSLKIDQ